jgi:hypothetical protein
MLTVINERRLRKAIDLLEAMKREAQVTHQADVTVRVMLTEGTEYFLQDLVIVYGYSPTAREWLDRVSDNEGVGRVVWMLWNAPILFGFCSNLELLTWAEIRATVEEVATALTSPDPLQTLVATFFAARIQDLLKHENEAEDE